VARPPIKHDRMVPRNKECDDGYLWYLPLARHSIFFNQLRFCFSFSYFLLIILHSTYFWRNAMGYYLQHPCCSCSLIVNVVWSSYKNWVLVRKHFVVKSSTSFHLIGKNKNSNRGKLKGISERISHFQSLKKREREKYTYSCMKQSSCSFPYPAAGHVLDPCAAQMSPCAAHMRGAH
jgi:hypothetical protein